MTTESYISRFGHNAISQMGGGVDGAPSHQANKQLNRGEAVARPMALAFSDLTIKKAIVENLEKGGRCPKRKTKPKLSSRVDTRATKCQASKSDASVLECVFERQGRSFH